MDETSDRMCVRLMNQDVSSLIVKKITRRIAIAISGNKHVGKKTKLKWREFSVARTYERGMYHVRLTLTSLLTQDDVDHIFETVVPLFTTSGQVQASDLHRNLFMVESYRVGHRKP